MLEQILDHIHNYFIKDVHRGEYKIASNTINLPFLVDGQYFKIIGSIFNDGLHEYPAFDLHDETFEGEIWALAIPNAVINLSREVDDWIEKYGEQAASPYQSESFGGYSYSKKSSGSQSFNRGDAFNWQDVFKSRLNHWRKIS